MTKRELEQRLITYSSSVLKAVQKLKKDQAKNHLVGQIIRSSTAVALNYGEAQSAESKRDFIHKVGVVLKELRETYINLSLLTDLEEDTELKCLLESLVKENDELIAIFHKTVMTAKQNLGSNT